VSLQANQKRPKRDARQTLTDDIVGRLLRRRSTADALFHAAMAERLGLGPTDHKCLDLLREHGTLTGSELAAITGLTSGAVTGIVARLEDAGYLRRTPDRRDGRKQILSPIAERIREAHAAFAPLRADMVAVLASFDADQLAAIADFLARSTDVLYRHVALLRTRALSPDDQSHRRGRT
jgi:DNA-binding MarR family transcriptional regulator